MSDTTLTTVYFRGPTGAFTVSTDDGDTMINTLGRVVPTPGTFTRVPGDHLDKLNEAQFEALATAERIEAAEALEYTRAQVEARIRADNQTKLEALVNTREAQRLDRYFDQGGFTRSIARVLQLATGVTPRLTGNPEHDITTIINHCK